MSKTKHTTFRFNEKLKEKFKEECFLNGIDMTEVLESLMNSYVTISEKKRLYESL